MPQPVDKQLPTRPQEDPECRNIHVSATAPGQFEDGHYITPEAMFTLRGGNRLEANDAGHFDLVSKYTGD